MKKNIRANLLTKGIFAQLFVCLFLLGDIKAESYPDDSNMSAMQADDVVHFDSGAPDLDSVSGGTLFLKSAKGNTMAPLLSSTVQTNISGVVAKVVIEQTFHNTSAEWVEGLYTFPLADQAAVNAMDVSIGERKIVGKIREKEQAKREFAKAKSEGKVAGLVSQHRPNLFSSRFANIAPGEKISITLTYIQTVPFENSLYRLRIPLTLTPRFSNTLVTDVAAITPPFVDMHNNHQSQPIDHTVTIAGTAHGDYDARLFSSPSHALNIEAGGNQLTYALRNAASLDRDFILEWTLPDAAEPVARVWRESVGQQEYLLASILPPKNNELIPDQPRELILVIDTSGSMAGDSIVAAKTALLSALSGLRETDKFNIIEFNSQHTSSFNSPQFANAKNLRTAERFINRLRADGGTQMLPALQSALGFQHSGLLRQVVFVTDGSVGYEDSVITAVTKQLRSARLFTVGIGTAPNQWFMRKVAEAGRGTAEFITNADEVVPVMADLLFKLESPALTNIMLDFKDSQTDYVPNPIPDLYANDAVIVAAKLGNQSRSLSISGSWGESIWNQNIDLTSTPLVETGLATVWAQRTIESLEDKQRMHSQPDYYRASILNLALEHQLLSQYTSFLAVEATPSKPQMEKLANAKIPNLIPAGNDMLNIPMPRGAAGSDTRLLISMLLVMLVLIVYYKPQLKKRAQLQ